MKMKNINDENSGTRSLRTVNEKSGRKPAQFYLHEARDADSQENLKTMRSAAMEFRYHLAPDHYNREFSGRTSCALYELKRAMAYRDMARNMGKWERTESGLLAHPELF